MQEKIYQDLLKGASRLYLSKAQLIEAEKARRKYQFSLGKLGRAALGEKEEIDAVNFVYTTLSTEGVPITKEDASLAYNLSQQTAKSVRDENLRVALDMINGLRCVKESSAGITLGFLLRLHSIIMGEYAEKNPGALRKKQAFIYLKSYQKAQEIGFRPPPPQVLKGKLDALIVWYNENAKKLNAIELAALLHLRFYSIHPFEDGNKRMSRLLLNKALFDCGYPMMNISNETSAYFDALIKSVETGNEKPFAEFVYTQVFKAYSLKRKTQAKTQSS